MTTTVRYQNITNTLGAAFTVANFPFTSDGDDRPEKLFKRIVATADVGTGAGQLGHASGAIVGLVPSTSNVLWIQGTVYRPQTPVAGVTPYTNISGLTFPIVTPLTQVNVEFALGLDNTIRAIDVSQGGTAALAAGDIITVRLTMGAAVDPTDHMN